MSNTDKDKEFYAMADAYIALANKQSENTDPGKVSATFLYAAARFNIFLVATGAASADAFAAKKEDIVAYFMAEYKKMLEEHFADYKANFESYLGKKK
jgi:O-acetyl-ADP-ribose deacetylase (regulator of RNase III)